MAGEVFAISDCLVVNAISLVSADISTSVVSAVSQNHLLSTGPLNVGSYEPQKHLTELVCSIYQVFVKCHVLTMVVDL